MMAFKSATETIEKKEDKSLILCILCWHSPFRLSTYILVT